jgi:hypothetical protein
MSPADLVQLGTIQLDLSPARDTDSSVVTSIQHEAIWCPLDSELFNTFDFAKTAIPIVQALRALLEDRAAGLDLSYQKGQDRIALRVSILPSDAKHSQWKRIPDKAGNRVKHLSTLFHHMRKSWESDEAAHYLLSRSVCDT